MNKSCQFCTSEIPSNAEKCPKCGGMQISKSPIPPPSPYFESVMQPDPPEVSDTIEPFHCARNLTGKPYVAPTIKQSQYGHDWTNSRVDGHPNRFYDARLFANS